MSSPISDEERDRFLRELVANSPDNGITPEERDAALRQFIHMLVDYGAISMWYEGRIQMGWGPNGMVWHLTEVTA